MAENGLPTSLELRVVTPAGELVHQDVDAVQAPGIEGYFGVLPGHTPFLTALGIGELSYRSEGRSWFLTCFGGFCEVLPDRVTVLADIGERAEEIDVGRAEAKREWAETRMKAISEEAGYAEARQAWQRAVTRLAVARKQRGE